MSTLHMRDSLVVDYTECTLKRLLSNNSRRISVIPDFLKMVDFPTVSNRERVQLDIRPITDLGRYRRKANLYELIWFGLSNTSILSVVQSLEGFDQSIEELAKELKIKISIPTISIIGENKIKIHIERWDRRRDCKNELVVVF